MNKPMISLRIDAYLAYMENGEPVLPPAKYFMDELEVTREFFETVIGTLFRVERSADNMRDLQRENDSPE